MALIGDLALEIGRPVDLIDLNSVGEPLLGQIVTGGRRLMGSDTHYAELIRKHLAPDAAAASLARVQAMWDQTLGAVKVKRSLPQATQR